MGRSLAYVMVPVVLLAPLPAGADERDGASRRVAFEAATALIGVDDARAVAALVALADAHPDDEFAPDALIEAASLEEDRLLHPDRAAALYGRILDRFPNHRLARRARARRDFLAGALRSGVEPLAAYQEILARQGQRSLDDTIARMEDLLAKHPAFALASEAKLWMAQRETRAGRGTQAMNRIAALRTAPDPIGRRAALGYAEAALMSGELLTARSAYLGQLERSPSDGAARSGIATTHRAIVRRGLFVASLAMLLVFVLVSLRRARAMTVPLELKFYLPVALLFTVAALRAERAILLAVALMAIGGALVIWLSAVGASSSSHRSGSWSARIRSFGLSTLAAIAVCYIAFYAAGIVPLVGETIRFGPDR